MRVCETRKRASYRSVAAFPAALWSMSLIPIGRSETTFHACLSASELNNARQTFLAANKIHPGGRARHSSAKSSQHRTIPQPD